LRPDGRSHGNRGRRNVGTRRCGNGGIPSNISGSGCLAEEGLPLSGRGRGSLSKGGVGASTGRCGDGSSRSGNSDSRRLTQGERGTSGCSFRFRIITVVTVFPAKEKESTKGTTTPTGEIATATEAMRICNLVVDARRFKLIVKFAE
tara:strand:+ start:1124 stop:1564 length:441 start_codon:yes stop_codon:yes gene_type:complete